MKNKIKITPELARIVAHICADGYLCTANYRRSTKELISHSRRNIFRNKFAIRYVNTEQVLIEQFESDAKKAFNRKVITIKTNEHEL